MHLHPFFLQPSLASWEAQPIHPDTCRPPQGTVDFDHHRRIVAVEPPGPPQAEGPFERARRAILSYDVFPPSLATRVVRRAPVEVGDTLGMRYHLFPGIRLFFASRVCRVLEETSQGVLRAGFTYQTLLHHPELGEETFGVEKVLSTGEVRVFLKAWSRPSRWLVRLMRPLARHWQLGAGRAALDHLERIAR